MTTKTEFDELEAIHAEQAFIAQVAELTDSLNESRAARHSLVPESETADLLAAQAAYDEAQSTYDQTVLKIAENHEELNRLLALQRSGDRTVTAQGIRSIRDEIETLENYLEFDKRNLSAAERKLAPLQADQHLARLAAEIIQHGTDAPVIIRRSPADAPDITPAIILTQTTPTADYGTLEANGEVGITLIGSPSINWGVVEHRFSELDCQGKISKSGIIFDKALWDVPRLAEPSLKGFASLVNSLGTQWVRQVTGADEAERLKRSGYEANVTSVWSALFDRGSLDFTFEDGVATGTATVFIAAQQTSGWSMGLLELQAEFESAVASVRRTLVGAITEAGEVTDIAFSGFKSSGHQWREQDLTSVMGSKQDAVTAEVTITAAFAYEQA